MKKLLLLAVFTVVGFASTQAQETSFGVTAGYTNMTAKLEEGNMSLSTSESGFYIGALVDLSISEEFHIQPEVLYARASEANFLQVPVLAKYYIADSGFQIMAGPQGTLTLDETIEGLNSFGLDLTLGVAYEITENFFLDARYSLEVTNRLKDVEGDVTYRLNALNIGVGYKF